ncbi:MAG: hypothetical protein M1840_008369 [Geoglossum simile]|nr:MAG: hypothetical protein M1840_008369 [Geoglossum simile]
MASGSRNFLKELYTPECAELDIVAVHGLNPTDKDSHAQKTWTASNGKMWLKDFLTKKLQTARILLFGYNANVAFQTSAAGVREQAENLLNRLNGKRRMQDAMDRPIIFICYSLGGLIVKRALVTAKVADIYLPIRNATYGIVFFGTPHQGGNCTSLGGIAASIARLSLRNPSNSFMEALKADSLFADDLVQDFRQQLEDYYVLSFYETLPFKKLGVVVDKRSATLDLPLTRETQIALDANHSDICKFEAIDSDDYEQVEDNIVEFAERALHDVAEKARLATRNVPGTGQLSITPVSEIPFRRNGDFIGREPILVQLKELLAHKEGYQPRALLYGLGGTGKTQIAVEYAYRAESNGVKTYWVNGESDETFTVHYTEIAKASSLAITDEKTETICARVKAWLESNDSGNWLLIIDNFDDIFLKSAHWLPLRNGAILLTSRDKRAAGTITGANAGIGVGIMTDSEAMQTFARLTTGGAAHIGQPETKQLIGLLENLPLAIVQAAAYIRQTGISTTDYISSFLSSERGREELFDNDLKSSGDSSTSSRSVMTTWAITVETIQKENPLAVQLLQLMSFLDGQSIPKSLLSSLHWPEFGNKLILAKTIGALINFSLVSQLGQYDYRLHGLVGFWTRVCINAESREKFLGDATQLVSMNFPEGTFDNERQCSLLLPHAASIVEDTEETNQPSRAIRDLELRMAQHLEERGLYQDAEKYAQKSLDVSRVLGLGNQDLMKTCLELSEKDFRRDHPLAPAAANNMGGVYDGQGHYDEALKWYGRALAGEEGTLGRDHSSTLEIINNMGVVYWKQAKYGEALKWLGQALAGREKVLGPKHVSALETTNEMGNACYSRGKYDEALKWYGQALAGMEKVLRPDHPSALETVSNMGHVYYSQHNYNEALKWHRRALAGREKMLGLDHPSTLVTVTNMGHVYHSQRNYNEALKWHRRALAGREKTLGPDHPSTLVTVTNMGHVYRSQSNYNEALKWYGQALAGREKTLGPDHPRTVATVGDISRCKKTLGGPFAGGLRKLISKVLD